MIHGEHGKIQLAAKYSGWRIVQPSRTSLEVGGKARCWNIGIMECWAQGLEYWNDGKME